LTLFAIIETLTLERAGWYNDATLASTQLRSNEKELGMKLSHLFGYGANNKTQRLNTKSHGLNDVWQRNWGRRHEYEKMEARHRLLKSSMTQCCVHPATMIVDCVDFHDTINTSYTSRHQLASMAAAILKLEVELKQLKF